MNKKVKTAIINDGEVVEAIFAELRRAEIKFPGFPRDPIHAAAIIAEELGELQQAILQWTYEGGSREKVVKEAVQTAAMTLRFCFTFPDMLPRPSGDLKNGRKAMECKNRNQYCCCRGHGSISEEPKCNFGGDCRHQIPDKEKPKIISGRKTNA